MFGGMYGERGNYGPEDLTSEAENDGQLSTKTVIASSLNSNQEIEEVDPAKTVNSLHRAVIYDPMIGEQNVSILPTSSYHLREEEDGRTPTRSTEKIARLSSDGAITQHPAALFNTTPASSIVNNHSKTQRTTVRSLLTLLAICAAGGYSADACQRTPVSDFDFEKFCGEWFEVLNLGGWPWSQYSWRAGCQFYAGLSDDQYQVDVVESAYNPDTSRLEDVEGWAELDRQGAGRFTAHYPELSLTSTYWVLETDYAHYAILYEESPADTAERAWVLTRSPALTQEQRRFALRRARAHCLPAELFTDTQSAGYGDPQEAPLTATGQ